jgi:Tfp pilus assembly protein PilX
MLEDEYEATSRDSSAGAIDNLEQRLSEAEQKLTEAEKKVEELEKKSADREAKAKARRQAASARAAVVTAAKKLNVKGLKAVSKKKKVTVSWKKTPGASGYQVQYAKKGEAFKNLKKATTKTSVKSKKLKKKAKYSFRVRTYKVVSGKKVYGKWATIKTVKIK